MVNTFKNKMDKYSIKSKCTSMKNHWIVDKFMAFVVHLPSGGFALDGYCVKSVTLLFV